MPFVLQQKNTKSTYIGSKNWSECAGSYSPTEAEALAELPWWQKYDADYKLDGWVYQVVQVKERKG